MKVLVLGGTGAMGMHLVHLLSNNGDETIVTSRKQRAAEENINYIQGNAHDIRFLQTILLEPLDAIVDFMIYTTQSFKERVNLLLDATSQYVFLSSSRVYADSETPITEDSSRLLDVSKFAIIFSSGVVCVLIQRVSSRIFPAVIHGIVKSNQMRMDGRLCWSEPNEAESFSEPRWRPVI